MRLPTLLLLAATLIACAPTAQRRGEAVAAAALDAQRAKTYQNPVINEDFPDPMVLRASDGFYYAYATQRPTEKGWINVPTYRSKDLINWSFVGDAMPVKPAWTRTTQNIWAPHVLEEKGRFYLYFSGERNGRQGHGVAVATASSPAGPFVGEAEPLAAGDSFVNIDPMPFDDPATGKKYLYWGSGFEPIRAQELTANRLAFVKGSRPVEVLDVSTRPYEHLIEGAWVTAKNGWYYLYYSGDDCCGDPPKYVTLVARAKSPLGPFTKGDDPVVGDGPRWKGCGHNAVVTDGAGADWLVYHARDERQPFLPGGKSVRRPLLIDRLTYVDGWPAIANDRASEGRNPAPTP